MSGGARVDVDTVWKHFSTAAGMVRAVNGVSLCVDAGGSLAITGPSGCGKSTLLSLIGGLEPPDDGTVTIGGDVVSTMAERDRARVRREHLGFIFQSHNLQPFLTAAENVSLPLALNGAVDGYERSLDLLDGLGLAGAVDKFPDQLSGGERQRVAVARALVHHPSVILADEPTGSLDADNSVAVIDLLRAAQLELGATLIVITHDPAVAERLDDELRLRDGEAVVPRFAAARLEGEAGHV
jgi:ABC-type lipoprotein export system ATPase subunit